MSEPTITCPKCKHEITLNKSLATPYILKLENDFELRLVNLSEQLAQKEKEVFDLKDRLNKRELKLAEAQKEQIEALKLKQELADEKREFDLTVQKGIAERLTTVREQARKEVEDEQKLKIYEKNHLISQLHERIDDLKRHIEQGSQQLQGEVQELELESLLRTKFPTDLIKPVGKGQKGADALQEVIGKAGQNCGTILWESKRTKNWSDGWLTKLRQDQNEAKADIAVIVTQALPKGVESFDIINRVWVVDPQYAIPVAIAIRQSLEDVSVARQSAEGQQTKMALLYTYFTGTNFKLRVEAVIESFKNMKTDLEKEKKAITAQWAKRDQEITIGMGAAIGMCGDLKGIAGQSFPDINGLNLEDLDDKS